MLHLRAISPADRTDAVLATLSEQPGVANLSCSRGAAVAPAGDVVEADLARESADEVIGVLTAERLDRRGSITLTELDAVLSDAADKAEQRAKGDAADAVIWQELVSRTGEESRLSPVFQTFLTIACLLAAIGVVTDSTVTLVGAMVVGPEFGPLAGIAVGIVLRRWDLMRRAVFALAVGYPLAMLVTAGFTLLGKETGFVNAETLLAERNVDFVYQFSGYSVLIALLAGAAGMLAMTSEKSAALVGVFISVTTIPAAGYAVVAAVLGEWDRCVLSLVQLLVNLVGLVLAAALVLALRLRRDPKVVLPTRPLPRG
ncbi:hypothetical protein BAY61_20250 [Prauserella marina]|uniref:Uncharacterized hydrophobic domain-containing protein n=1 Tax=Prauserella marina TaxID=530584 RepID=A0A222VSP7_9PSEU|nr:DUF389 domain-containing protein [Prauserella marina]ASR36929.1 hypothetical protein BAY61_20250 [Prauserella marina]PWV80122.1 putative hydrophobic protein (TIGR00271 family) [Prauserella marina]SDD82716.1 uncharacterized hydrophobic domain-containing protein [Prauserella marina]